MVNFCTGKGFICGGNMVSISGHSQDYLAITWQQNVQPDTSEIGG
jgi:hypothetical protein